MFTEPSEKVQQKWHETTGYLPTTIGAYEKTKAGRYYKENPASRLAVEQVIERANQDLPNGMRITNYGPVREKIIDSIESILVQKKPTEEALNLAVKEAQLIIDQKP